MKSRPAIVIYAFIAAFVFACHTSKPPAEEGGATTIRFGLVTDSHFADADARESRPYRASLEKMRAAMAKLISAMPPTLSGHLERLVQGLPTQADPRYAAVFRAVVYGWATRRTVDLAVD